MADGAPEAARLRGSLSSVLGRARSVLARSRAADRLVRVPPRKIASQDANGVTRWFEGGKLNTAWLALDRHVQAGFGDRCALIYDSPAAGTQQRFSYAELLHRVEKVAGGLVELGVEKGRPGW